MSTVRTAPAGRSRGADFASRVRRGYHTPAQAHALQRAVDIWTRATDAGLRSASFEPGSSGPAWRGLPDARVAALDAAAALARDLGRFGGERLKAYGLKGLTLAEMAERFAGGDTRIMATILDSDLNGVVRHFQRREGGA